MNKNPDLSIAQNAKIAPITKIAERAEIPLDSLIPYGHSIAKVDPSKLSERANSNPSPLLILVTAMSPTPSGEGKTTLTVGLGDALTLKGKKSFITLREPSMGPLFGRKGGAAGGGYSQVVPMEQINMHFTGDIHAVTAANNALSAFIDNHLHQGNPLGIDPRRIIWKRVMDMNDRALRKVIVGLGSPINGVPREDGFDITVASELEAIFCLATSLQDLRERISQILIGYTYDRKPVTVADLGVEGALTVLLKDALAPNLVQTLGGTPAFVHGSPFANIAHGCNSLLATQSALQLADVVISEAGFGSDLGAEKFVDIKCRIGHIRPDAAVVVTTVRALKYHGGVNLKDIHTENIDAVKAGMINLEKHIEVVRTLGTIPVVAVNKFTTDTEAELDAIRSRCAEIGVRCAVANVWEKGGEGGLELADEVLDAAAHSSSEHTELPYLYKVEDSVEDKLTTIAQKIYGAAKIELSASARKDLTQIEKNGWDKLPICVAKTPASFSDDPKVLGAPSGHTLHVQQLIPKLGAGFIVAMTGSILTMPGLPSTPNALSIDVDDKGNAVGIC